ncbi:MAG: LytR/AlgR family response regulator transcription factor [Bacteroidia bacterium]
MPIKVVIIDDEPRALDTLKKTIENFVTDVNVVATASNIADAIDAIKTYKPSLVLLDIEMGNESGFQVLEQLDDINFNVAFVTAHEEYALRAIKFSAIDYIIKPAKVSELKALMVKVETEAQKQVLGSNVKQMIGNNHNIEKGEHKITLAVAEGYEFVRVNDILHITADGSYTHFTIRDSASITTSKNLKFYENILDEYGFYRIHNSTLINTKYIRRILKTAGGQVLMENDTEFSISKSRKDDFLNFLALK